MVGLQGLPGLLGRQLFKLQLLGLGFELLVLGLELLELELLELELSELGLHLERGHLGLLVQQLLAELGLGVYSLLLCLLWGFGVFVSYGRIEVST